MTARKLMQQFKNNFHQWSDFELTKNLDILGYQCQNQCQRNICLERVSCALSILPSREDTAIPLQSFPDVLPLIDLMHPAEGKHYLKSHGEPLPSAHRNLMSDDWCARQKTDTHESRLRYYVYCCFEPQPILPRCRERSTV